MAKISMDAVIKALDGIALKGQDDKDMTLGMICTNVLLINDDKMAGEEKYANWKLAERIYEADSKETELTAEEITNLKKLIGIHHFPIIVGQCWKFLENKK